jgi:glycerophosphoryl diester phosphodiesterase
MRSIHYIIILAMATLAACSPLQEIPNPEILITGHGGAGFETFRNSIPPNTIRSIKQALEIEGAEAVELDVQMTQDCVLVLYHDNDLVSATDCQGCIPTKTWHEIQPCNILNRYGPMGSPQNLPRLDSALQPYLEGDRRFFLNLKIPYDCSPEPDKFRDAFIQTIGDWVEGNGMKDRVWLETFDLEMLVGLQREDSTLRLIYDDDQVDRAISTAVQYGFAGIGVVNEAMDAQEVAHAQSQGLMVVIWGVRVLEGTKQAVSKGPDAIMTDDIRMLRNVLGR